MHGLLIHLYGAQGVVLETVMSNEEGLYAFEQRASGTFRVEYDLEQLPGFVPSPCDVGDDESLDSDCAPLEFEFDSSENLQFDFGFLPPLSGIGDRVWLDVDCNGLQNMGEPGLEGVRVLLRDGAGALLDEQITGAGGRYFFEGLGEGHYQVEVDESTLLASLEASPCQVDQDPELDSNCAPAPVELLIDEPLDLSVDFGFGVCPSLSVLGDRVWHDLDRDGVQDAGEPGLEGVQVELLGSDGGSLAQSQTGPGGSYFFIGLPAGPFTVRVDESSLPQDFEATPCEQGGSPARDSNCSPALVDVATPLSFDPTIDFGYASPCEGFVGNYLWHDLDCNGIQDGGEPGLQGVRIGLYDGQGTFLEAIYTTQRGAYSLRGLCAGAYELRVDESTLPTGFQQSPPGQGSDDQLDSNGSPATFRLGEDEGNPSIDFGYCSPSYGHWGGFAWIDTDGDGVREAGEPPLAGVDLHLQTLGDRKARICTTGSEGRYDFSGLAPGRYRVLAERRSLPPWVDEGPAVQGRVFTIEVGSLEGIEVDFGYRTRDAGSIRGQLGPEGSRPPGLDLTHTRVVLFDLLGSRLATAFTDSEGHYAFPGVPAGTYVVEVDEGTLPDGITMTGGARGDGSVTVRHEGGAAHGTVDFPHVDRGGSPARRTRQEARR